MGIGEKVSPRLLMVVQESRSRLTHSKITSLRGDFYTLRIHPGTRKGGRRVTGTSVFFDPGIWVRPG